MKTIKKSTEIFTSDNLADCFHFDQKHFDKHTNNIKYVKFKIPKRKGGFRLIEHPHKGLVKIQDKLAIKLGLLYSKVLPDCSHGYISKQMLPEDQRRDIFSNATVHLGSKYLYNIDIENFFHGITGPIIDKIFTKHFPELSPLLLKDIKKVVLFEGRLPMGASSSPVMSNICALDLDMRLRDYAINNKLKYSRYVDDISFSRDQKIKKYERQNIKKLIKDLGFVLNVNKEKYYSHKQDMIITGLVINNGIIDMSQELEQSIMTNLKKLAEIKKTYDHLRLLNLNQTKAQKAYKQLKQGLKGQIRFIKRCIGTQDNRYKRIKKTFVEICQSSAYLEQTVYF